LTVKDRTWWEDRLAEAGFSKHPDTQQIVGDETSEKDKLQITVANQKILPAVIE